MAGRNNVVDDSILFEQAHEANVGVPLSALCGGEVGDRPDGHSAILLGQTVLAVHWFDVYLALYDYKCLPSYDRYLVRGRGMELIIQLLPV